MSRYICAACHQEFESLDDEAAEAERRELWAPEIAAGARPENFDVLCDDCFSKFMQWFASESDIVRP